MMPRVLLTYDGGLAAQGQMRLYEYGRSQYAFSRILTTVEQYRRTGIIIDRVTPRRRVDLIVSTPRRGSFQLDVDVDAPPARDDLPGFDALFALVLDRLIPPGEEFSELAVELARIKRVEQRTGKHTGPEVSGAALRQLENIIDGGAAAPEVLLELVVWARDSTNRAIARADISDETLDRARVLIQSDIRRKQLVQEHAGRVNPRDLDRLAGRVRPIFKELAVPLGSSAELISLGRPGSKSGFYAFDERRLEVINERLLDEDEREIVARIKAFDVETGFGSFRSNDFKGVQRFSIDPEVRDVVQPKVVSVMEAGDVTFDVAVYTDVNGIITSYVVRDVQED